MIDNIFNDVNIVNIVDLLLQLSVVGSLLTGVNGVSAAILLFCLLFFFQLGKFLVFNPPNVVADRLLHTLVGLEPDDCVAVYGLPSPSLSSR